MMRSTVTQVAVATLAISMFICNSESAKSFDGTSGDVRVRIEVKIPDEGSSAAGPKEEVFIAGNIKQLGTWQPKGLKLDRTEANVFGADFSVPVGTRMQFKVTRGSWQTVEKDKLGKDIANREAVATASEDGVPQKVLIVVERWGLSRPVKSTATGTIQLHDQFASKHLMRSRKRLEAGGKGLDYIRFMTEELKPFIDSTYRTKTDRSSTYIGGSSLGGLIAMHACLQEPEVFGCCLAFSPTLGWDNARLLTLFQSEAAELRKNGHHDEAERLTHKAL